jgi:hypothetical protein
MRYYYGARKNTVKVLFCSMAPDIRNSIARFEGFRASPAFPSDSSSITMSIGNGVFMELY